MTWLLLLKHVQNSVCEALPPQTPEPIDTTISERIFNLIQEAYACVDHSVLPVCPSIHIHTRTASGETGAVANGLTNEIHIYVRKEAQRTGLYHTPFLRYVVYHEMGHIALRHGRNIYQLMSRLFWSIMVLGGIISISLSMYLRLSVIHAWLSSLLSSFFLGDLATRLTDKINLYHARIKCEPEADEWAVNRLLEGGHHESVAAALCFLAHRHVFGLTSPSHPPALSEFKKMHAQVEEAGYRIAESGIAGENDAEGVRIRIHHLRDDNMLLCQQTLRVNESGALIFL